jgi:glycosyltransferase involved in cell wall biosynthesis
VIVGTGPLRADLERQIAALGATDKVILAGRQSDAALHALFRRSELFCLSSIERSEAFGVVLVEAMSHGLPIVATQIEGSGVSWVNQDGVTGLNVPVGDPQALADACNQILSSPELRERFARGARQRFEREFAEQVSVDRMLDVYSRTLRAEPAVFSCQEQVSDGSPELVHIHTHIDDFQHIEGAIDDDAAHD